MSGLFNIGLTGLKTAQSALSTTGHNIANVNTPGYSRQRVDIAALPARGTGAGFFGSGVEGTSVRRAVDHFLTEQVRSSTSAHAGLDRFHALSASVDNLLADPDGGLSPALRDFFSSVEELANDPSSLPARSLTIARAESLVERVHALDNRLNEIRRGVEASVADLASDITSIASDVATLNRRIAESEGRFGQPANDLRDARDNLVRELSSKIELTVIEQDDGMVNIVVGAGQSLVVGGASSHLGVAPDPYDPTRGQLSSTLNGVTAAVGTVRGGEIGGLLRFRSEVLDAAQSGIGRVAVGLTETINAQHRLGVDLAGRPGGDFFAPLGLEAPRVLAHDDNAGAAEISVQIADVGALGKGDYELRRDAGVYTLRRLDDGASWTLDRFPASAQTVDGLRLELESGGIVDGDAFLIQPTRTVGRDLALAVTGPEQIAAASPIRTSVGAGNVGSTRVDSLEVNSPDNELVLSFSSPTTFDVTDRTTGATLATGQSYVDGGTVSFNGMELVIAGTPATGDSFSVRNTVASDDPGNTGTATLAQPTVLGVAPQVADAVTITFDDPPTTFSVNGATSGSPTSGVAFTPGEAVSFNGWTVRLQGAPAAGDTITVQRNAGAVGDNRNVLAMARLETEPLLSGGSATFQDAYGQVVVDVGARTRQAEVSRSAQATLLEQATAQHEAAVGVNLDEEAANMLRFQQAYQANAQVIATANAIFETLLAATGG